MKMTSIILILLLMVTTMTIGSGDFNYLAISVRELSDNAEEIFKEEWDEISIHANAMPGETISIKFTIRNSATSLSVSFDKWYISYYDENTHQYLSESEYLSVETESLQDLEPYELVDGGLVVTIHENTKPGVYQFRADALYEAPPSEGIDDSVSISAEISVNSVNMENEKESNSIENNEKDTSTGEEDNDTESKDGEMNGKVSSDEHGEVSTPDFKIAFLIGALVVVILLKRRKKYDTNI